MIGGFDRGSSGMIEGGFGSGFKRLGGGRGFFSHFDVVIGIHGSLRWVGEHVPFATERSSSYDCKPARTAGWEIFFLGAQPAIFEKSAT
ncbi:msl7436 [Mesorhizobium japonicum MAFF 303099]|uniref:Msl7436 protein n=1 Tax=Mesorhizobium japonicum (strain LMG 29417 / CECT 9101 / MAFF 303099) TaxID=266835 RepID=Q986B4_RHILO|nr:msl7436 [Mesorhizobium japonicum MAFF 303099]